MGGKKRKQMGYKESLDREDRYKTIEGKGEEKDKGGCGREAN